MREEIPSPLPLSLKALKVEMGESNSKCTALSPLGVPWGSG